MEVNKITKAVFSFIFCGFLNATDIDQAIPGGQKIYQESYAKEFYTEGESLIDQAVSRKKPIVQNVTTQKAAGQYRQQFIWEWLQDRRIGKDRARLQQENGQKAQEFIGNVGEKMSKRADDLFNDEVDFNRSKEAFDSLHQQCNRFFNEMHTKFDNFIKYIKKNKTQFADNQTKQQTQAQAAPVAKADNKAAQAPAGAKKVSQVTDAKDAKQQTENAHQEKTNSQGVDNKTAESDAKKIIALPIVAADKQKDEQSQVSVAEFTITAQQLMACGAVFAAVIGGGYMAYQYIYAPEEDFDEEDLD